MPHLILTGLSNPALYVERSRLAPSRVRKTASAAGPPSEALVLGDFGSNVCPAGFTGIGSEVACQFAVSTLGFVYVKNYSNSAYPKGCYGNGTHAWLNTHPTGSASATRQRICQPAPVASCNETVFVDGAGGSLSSRMGYYNLVEGLVQGGRPVYKSEPTVITVYLFYWASSGRWYIGADYTSSAASLRAQSLSACPDAATGWQVLSNSVWTSADSLVVTAWRSEDCPARWSLLACAHQSCCC